MEFQQNKKLNNKKLFFSIKNIKFNDQDKIVEKFEKTFICPTTNIEIGKIIISRQKIFHKSYLNNNDLASFVALGIVEDCKEKTYIKNWFTCNLKYLDLYKNLT